MRRELAERLSARAIRGGVNLEAVVLGCWARAWKRSGESEGAVPVALL